MLSTEKSDKQQQPSSTKVRITRFLCEFHQITGNENPKSDLSFKVIQEVKKEENIEVDVENVKDEPEQPQPRNNKKAEQAKRTKLETSNGSSDPNAASTTSSS